MLAIGVLDSISEKHNSSLELTADVAFLKLNAFFDNKFRKTA